MSKNLWAIIMYTGVFLVWNHYKDADNHFFTVTGLKLTGMAILVFCFFKFKSGQPENEGSIIVLVGVYLG